MYFYPSDKNYYATILTRRKNWNGLTVCCLQCRQPAISDFSSKALGSVKALGSSTNFMTPCRVVKGYDTQDFIKYKCISGGFMFLTR